VEKVSHTLRIAERTQEGQKQSKQKNNELNGIGHKTVGKIMKQRLKDKAEGEKA
jgi:hypothetical protein